MKKEKAKRSGGWQRGVLIALCVFLALVLALMIACSVFLNSWMSNISRTGEEDNYTLSQEELSRLEQEQIDEEGTGTGPVINESDVIWAPDPSELVGEGEEIVNILLIGQDRRPGEGRARSDSMILCTFNRVHKTLTMTSFLRDLYVQIPGYESTRLNAAYALGGMELLDKTLEQNFGVHVDANIEVDFSGFQEIIDLLGGVDIYLTEAEANYLSGGDWWPSSGMNHLNGAQALSYSRIRYIDSDFYRTDRQRNVLSSVIEAYKGLSMSEFSKLIDGILPLVTTDMTNAEITSYATQIFPMMAKCTLNTQRIPIADGYEGATIRGMQVLVPDLEVNRQFLVDTLTKEALGEDPGEQP